jgi:hypothetical protein
VSDREQKYSGDNFRGADHASPYPVSRLGALSMLGPDEYGGAGPSGFVASFRYEHDESWTRVDEIAGRDRRRAEIQALVSNRLPGAPEAP